MAGRRVLYITLLITAAVFHFAYGQYVTHYVLLFLLILPVLSLLLSLPAALSSRAELIGGADVIRNRESSVQLKVECGFFIPPEAWKITIEDQNLFTEKKASRKKLRESSVSKLNRKFSPDTSHLGTIRYTLKKAKVCDYLGLFAIPVKKSGAVSVTVLPDKEVPVPEPELVDPSERVYKPKPQGFSEEHELRPYRAGDPLNLIHWKLSVKYDDVIVREPQELIRKNIVLCADLPAGYDEQQSVLEQLSYLNERLSENQISYELHFGSKSLLINSKNDYDDFIRATLSEPMQPESALSVTGGSETLIYRIRPGRGVRA